VLVEVEDDAVTSARFEDTGLPVGPAQLAEYQTVDGLFDFLRDGAERADWLRAEFDRTLGFPRSAYVDWDRAAADEELGFELLSVTPAP
jgi:hypothetical protein